VLAIGPEVRGLKPGRGDVFLRAIKIRSTSFFGGEVKPSALCRKMMADRPKCVLFYQVFYYTFKVCNFVLINFMCKGLVGYNLKKSKEPHGNDIEIHISNHSKYDEIYFV
jgi:hypothetical protein